jgi:hypothetical protein
MRKLTLGLLTLALLASPVAASAGGFHLELSLGSGVTAGVGDTTRIPTNVGLTVGYGFTDMLKLQLGAIASLGDVQDSLANPTGSTPNLDLRAMVVVSPPLFPLYFRGILGITNLVEGSQDFTWGGAVGLGFGMFGIGAFIEAGGMQRTYTYDVAGVPTSEKGWQVEGRIGISIG